MIIHTRYNDAIPGRATLVKKHQVLGRQTNAAACLPRHIIPSLSLGSWLGAGGGACTLQEKDPPAHHGQWTNGRAVDYEYARTPAVID